MNSKLKLRPPLGSTEGAVRRPGLLPGLIAPAPLIAPTVPLPESEAPEETDTALPAMEPLTLSSPACTVVAPV